MDHEDAQTLTFPDGTPFEPWLTSYLRGRDTPFSEIYSQSQRSVALSSQTSGYFSTIGSVYNSTRSDNRPGSRHSVACRRDSLASQDTGSTVTNFTTNLFIGSALYHNIAPTASSFGAHDETQQVQKFIPQSTSNGVRRHRKIISRRNEKLLNEFAPQLVDSMDPLALLPHLMQHGLADTHDQDFITNPCKTNRDRNLYIIRKAPYKNSSAFEHFVECLEAVSVGPHSELASQIRQEMRNPSSAQLQPTEAVTTPQNVHYQEQPNRLQLERLHLPSNDGSADERLLESPTHEWEAFRQRQSSDPERLSSYSSSSELTESTLVPTQPSLSTNATEHTMYENAVMLQQYPERDIGPYSPVASCNMWQESNVTNTRRQTDREMQADVSHDDFSHNTSKMIKRRKLTWLQENTVIFNSNHEEITFTSLTNCQQQRKVLHYGTLFQQGKVRFVVLLTDFLLVLNLLEPRDHSRKAVKKQPFEDHMFSDNKYATNKPLLLHHFEVQDHNKQQCSFSLHCKLRSVDLCFEAPSKTARDVWLEVFSAAIKQSCQVQKRLRLPIGNEVVERISEHKLSLTILNVSGLQRHDYCRRLFCTVMLGRNRKCRTPSVEGKNTASWNFTFEFWRFTARDTLVIEVWQENIFRPNDCLGYIEYPIWAVTDKSTNTVYPGHEMEASLPLKPTRSGEIDFKIST